MAGYIGTAAVPQATQKRQAFTATAGQTSFATSGYSVGFVDVYMNGVKLAAADYTATNGSDVVLATAALVNDIVEIVAFTSFVASDGLAAANNLSDLQNASTARTNLGVTLPNLGVTSTAAELNNLDAVPRGSIIYGNSSAATARLSKGATGTVLTAGADDISWVAASSGGEQEFTASGSISAGNIVGINLSGTVEVMAQAESDLLQVGAVDPYQGDYFPIAADTDGNGKVLAVMAVSGGRPLAFVGTVSGTTISWGSAVEVTTATNQLHPSVTYDANAGKFLVFYYDHNGTYSNKAVVGTISGTTVSFGSIITVASSSKDGMVLYNPDTQSSLIFYRSNDNRLYAKVATISGTSVSVGSALTVESGANNVYPRLSYDTAANKYLAVYSYNNTDGAAKVLTVSGTSVTAGSRAEYEPSDLTYYNGSAYDPTANRHVIQYYYNNTTRVVAGTISGTSVTFGSHVQTPNSIFCYAYYNPVTQRTMLTGQGRIYYYTVTFGSGNTITIDTDTTDWMDTVAYSSANASPRFVNINSSRNVWIWEHTNQAWSKVTNDAMAKFVGIAAENISNGASGKVTVMGGINPSVSGLTAGKSYGLPATSASLIEIKNTASNEIFGTALSATSIYIDKGNLR